MNKEKVMHFYRVAKRDLTSLISKFKSNGGGHRSSTD